MKKMLLGVVIVDILLIAVMAHGVLGLIKNTEDMVIFAGGAVFAWFLHTNLKIVKKIGKLWQEEQYKQP